MKKAYSFLKRNSTEEKHIFEGEFTTESCTAPTLSICQKANKNQGTWITGSTCLTEQSAREKAGAIGKSVCGICVSHLYTTDY
ncbi:hypothetical protein [uncultured Flavobacterium sp.]|uniref:hypothetical protein n=1 Tax=uncultured Flavobacterium sp. TaxID=165435 RepID=UPI0025DDB262|nr:hypothetical protein [uncultured Flavobacterium sp.]